MKRKKRLIVLPNWVGDAIMATPLLREVSYHWKESDIIYAGNPITANIFRESPRCDGIMELPKKVSPSFFSGLKGVLENQKLYFGQNFDSALILRSSFSSALSTFLAKIPERMGYAREGRSFFLSKSLPHPKTFRKSHRVYYYLNLLELLDHSYAERAPRDSTLEIFLDEASRDWAKKEIRRLALIRPILAIHLGAAFGPSKRWPKEKFLDSLKFLRSKLPDFSILLVGSPGEKEENDAFLEAAKYSEIPGASFVGSTKGIVELAALLDECDLLLSNDSGPMHVAAALQKKQLAIFSSTNPDFSRPWSDHASYIAADLQCSPCFHRNCSVRRSPPFPCHENISCELVSRTLAELLTSS